MKPYISVLMQITELILVSLGPICCKPFGENSMTGDHTNACKFIVGITPKSTYYSFNVHSFIRDQACNYISVKPELSLYPPVLYTAQCSLSFYPTMFSCLMYVLSSYDVQHTTLWYLSFSHTVYHIQFFWYMSLCPTLYSVQLSGTCPCDLQCGSTVQNYLVYLVVY